MSSVLRIARLWPVFAAAFAIAIASGGCTGGCSSEEGKSEVAERMSDPVYRKQLDELDKEQRATMKRIGEARAALAAAKAAEGTDEETLARLQAEVDSALAALDQSHKKAQATVRAKINKALEQDAQKASGR